MKITIYVLISISILASVGLIAVKLNTATPTLNDNLYARTDVPLTGYKSY